VREKKGSRNSLHVTLQQRQQQQFSWVVWRRMTIEVPNLSQFGVENESWQPNPKTICRKIYYLHFIFFLCQQVLDSKGPRGPPSSN
jgi:hypothetical protein